MDESRFRELLEEYLVPMFAGTRLGAKESSTSRHGLSSYGGPTIIRLKPSRDSSYRVPLVRSHRFFEDNEKTLVDLFAREFASLAPLAEGNTRYVPELLGALPRRVLAQLLAKPNARTTAESVLRQFESLAAQTYEGRQVVAAVGITGSVGHGDVRIADMWGEDFARVLSNGHDTMYVVGSDGRAFNVEALEFPPKPGPYAPHRLAAVAHWTQNGKKIALALNRNGEVLVFGGGRLQFARRRGAWRYYAHDAMIQRMGNSASAELRIAMYESSLDVSFARTGGCIAGLRSNAYGAVKKLIQGDDVFPDGSRTRVRFLRQFLSKPFHKIERRLRQQILAMDGATVLTHNGEFVSAGAIVSVPGGSAGGGRRAAAVALSKYGVALKISADGPITGFKDGEEILQV